MSYFPVCPVGTLLYIESNLRGPCPQKRSDRTVIYIKNLSQWRKETLLLISQQKTFQRRPCPQKRSERTVAFKIPF